MLRCPLRSFLDVRWNGIIDRFGLKFAQHLSRKIGSLGRYLFEGQRRTKSLRTVKDDQSGQPDDSEAKIDTSTDIAERIRSLASLDDC